MPTRLWTSRPCLHRTSVPHQPRSGTSPSSVPAQPSPTANLPTPSKWLSQRPTLVRHPTTMPRPNPSHRPLPPIKPSPNQNRSSGSHTASLPWRRRPRRSQRCGTCSRRSPRTRRRRRCRSGRLTSTHMCAIWGCPADTASGA